MSENLNPHTRSKGLEKSIINRRIRAEIKRQLIAGEITVSEIIVRGQEEEAIGNMRVKEMLMCFKWVGPTSVKDLMRRLDISETRKIKGLGPNQMEALVEKYG